MGQVLAVPFAAVCSFCGTCTAVGCCKLASAGSTQTAKAASLLLLWLQVLSTLFAFVMSVDAHGWLSWPCNHLNQLNINNLGICECSYDFCFRDQVVYRILAATTILFFFLFALAVSGCGKAAATDVPFAKFLFVFVAPAIFLFISNNVFTTFSTFAGIISGFFLMMQTLLVVDFAYTWSEMWHTFACANDREHFNAWVRAIFTSSAVILLGAIAVCIYLVIKCDVLTARLITIGSLILSFVLLGVGTCEWCEHGALLTSAVMALYVMWVCYEAIEVLPDAKDGTHSQSTWIGLLITAVVLLTNASHTGVIEKHTIQQNRRLSTDSSPQLTHVEDSGPDRVGDGFVHSAEVTIDTKEFGMQCLVHTAATLYVCSVMAPHPEKWNFYIHEVAVVVSLALYGWSLVAPKVLEGRRSFDQP